MQKSYYSQQLTRLKEEMITQYFGIVSGETIIRANVFKISSQASRILSEDAQVLTKTYYAKQRNRLKNERSLHNWVQTL